MTAPESDQFDGLLVSCDAMPDGSYSLTVSIGGDRTWSLDRAAALDYAATTIAAATAAEHDAAVVSLAQARGLDLHSAAAIVGPIREKRAARAQPAPGFWLTPGVNAKTEPFIALHLGDQESELRQVGQTTPAVLRVHAGGVLSALAAVELDTHTRDVMVAEFELSTEEAQHFVHSLAEHWPGGGYGQEGGPA